MNFVFRLINTKKYFFIFGCWLLPENLALIIVLMLSNLSSAIHPPTEGSSVRDETNVGYSVGVRSHYRLYSLSSPHWRLFGPQFLAVAKNSNSATVPVFGENRRLVSSVDRALQVTISILWTIRFTVLTAIRSKTK